MTAHPPFRRPAGRSSVHVAVLHAQLDGGLLIAGTQSPTEYDRLLNTLQAMARDLCAELTRQGYPLAEWRAQGDTLALYFYDPAELERNTKLDSMAELEQRYRQHLIDQCRQSNMMLPFYAVRAAVQMMNHWLVREPNLERVMGHLDPWQLNITLHSGWAMLGQRADGKQRIEGHTVTLGQQLLQLAPRPRYSGIFATQTFHDMLRSTVIKHTQLRQRCFFRDCAALPGGCAMPDALELHELRFCHRVGVPINTEAIEQYEAIFNLNHSNIWAYYQLVGYYSYLKKDWNKTYELARTAQLMHPTDERVLLDLSKYYLHADKLEQSRLLAERALELNPTFDLAHEHLAVLAVRRKDVAAQVRHCRDSLSLSPGSPVNNLNLGLALLEAGEANEGFHFVQEALRLFPDFRKQDMFISALQRVKRDGKLPELLDAYLADDEEESAATTLPASAAA